MTCDLLEYIVKCPRCGKRVYLLTDIRDDGDAANIRCRCCPEGSEKHD